MKQYTFFEGGQHLVITGIQSGVWEVEHCDHRGDIRLHYRKTRRAARRLVKALLRKHRGTDHEMVRIDFARSPR